ncbi:MAG: NAD(P)H-dependent oxidoreductase [Candidatus Paceibacterota bacterium]|jgi:flavodoxin
MKILTIYYSLDGSTKLVAEALSNSVGADLLPLALREGNVKAQGFGKYFWGGKQVLFKERPELLPFGKDPSAYDVIFIGTPVWAGNYAPAIRSFFDRCKFSGKSVALFCTHEGGAEKTFENMREALSGNSFAGQMDFANVKKDPSRAAAKAAEWAKETVDKLQN